MRGNDLRLSLGRLFSRAARGRDWGVLDDVGRVNSLEATVARLIKGGAAGLPDPGQWRAVYPGKSCHGFVMVAGDHR
jgi:hypothetical protein